MKKDRPQLPGPNERWKPQIVVQPSPAPRDHRAGCTHRFLLDVGAVRYGSWQDDSPVVYSRTLGRTHPNFTQRRGRRGRFVRLVSNAVRARLLRVWSLYWSWWMQDFVDRWWHVGSKWRLATELRALLLSFNRGLRVKIVDSLTASEQREELWQLIRSTSHAKKTSRSSSGSERSARLEGRSPRSKSRPSSEAISLKPPASRAYEERTRYR